MFGGIPFDGFPGAGGSMRQSEPVDTTKLYETLGVDKTASSKDIKKAYRALSRQHHPDKGGDEHKFKEINAAYEVLSDPETREKYDQYGLEGVDRGAGGDGHGDLFSMFFGGGRSSQRSGPRKGPSVNHPLKVSLEDLYLGKTVKLAVNRKVIVGDVATCNTCRGQGAVMQIRQIGPGMIQQVQRTCDKCSGQGYEAKTKSERKILEVLVQKGMTNNHKISFANMGDEIPKMEPGDINFIVQEKPHELFKRKHADLLVTKELSLNQALCGFTWHITHLDGRQLCIKTHPGEIIHAEVRRDGKLLPFIKKVKDEGMPSLGNPFVRGDLYIAFEIAFPDKLSPEDIATLQRVLPDPNIEEEYENEEVEEHFMEEADLAFFGKGGAVSSANEYDSDEEGQGGQGVQCQQS